MLSLVIQRQIVVVVVIAISLQQHVFAQDICTKFDIGGPCLYLHPGRNWTYRFLTLPPTSSPFCSLACSQGNSELYSSVCPCSVPVASIPTEFLFTTTLETTTTLPPTTTTLSTTTPKPVTCYYSSQRPAKLNSIARRLYSSTPVTTECDYPGVVGLFREENGQLVFTCMASLLEEDVVLVNDKLCMVWIRRYQVYALADSYQMSKVTRAVSLNRTTATKLDTTGSLKSLYTVKLNSKLTLNDGCIQPVCVPNINIPAADIDLEDCRIVGYRDTTNTMGSTPPQLNEVKVRVGPKSVTNANLVVTRVDKKTGTACMGDDSAPLICSHKTTGEWVTIGITVTSGYPCAVPGFSKPLIASLLQEAPNKGYYNGIQKFKYANPDVFTAYMNSTVFY